MPSDPAVVTDDDSFGILDIVAAALHLGLVRGVHDGHVGAEHDPVADGDEAAVEDREVEVGVEAASQTVFASALERGARSCRCLVCAMT